MAKPQQINNSLHVAKIAELDEKMKGIAFEGLVLSRYGTYDFNRSSSFLNLRADLTDDEGFATVTLQINGQLIDKYEKYIQKNQHIRIENFIISSKKTNFDKGDANVVLRVYSQTNMFTLESKDIEINFFPNTNITSLLDVSSKDVNGTVAIVILEDGGYYEGTKSTMHYLQVADGKNEKDKETVTIFFEKVII